MYQERSASLNVDQFIGARSVEDPRVLVVLLQVLQVVTLEALQAQLQEHPVQECLIPVQLQWYQQTMAHLHKALVHLSQTAIPLQVDQVVAEIYMVHQNQLL